MSKTTVFTLRVEMNDLAALKAKANESNKEFEKLSKSLKKLKAELSATNDEGKKNYLDKKIKSVGIETEATRVKTAALTKEYKVLRGGTTDALKDMKARMDEFGNTAKSASAKATTGFSQLGITMGRIVGVGGVIGIGIKAYQRLISFADEFETTIKDFDERVADIRKVTNGTLPQVRALAKEIAGIDTRTSVQSLLDLAVAGGRLGLELKDLKGFVTEADKLFIALGDSLGGTAEEIALKMGKIASVFGLIEAHGVEEALNKVGSILNKLGASSAAIEPHMIDFVSRLAGIGSVAGITVAELSGLGATLDAGAQSMEIAATTIQRLLPSLAIRAGRFAKLLGVPIEEFSKTLEERPFEAFMQVIKGSEAAEGGLLGLAETLEFTDQEAARSAQILGFLSKQHEELEGHVATANEQLKNNTSINQEAAVKQNTLRAAAENTDRAYSNLIISIDDGDGPISRAIKKWEELKRVVFDFGSYIQDDLNLEDTQFFISLRQSLVPKFAQDLDLNNAKFRLKEFTDELKETAKTAQGYSDIVAGGAFPKYLEMLEAAGVAEAERVITANNLFAELSKISNLEKNKEFAQKGATNLLKAQIKKIIDETDFESKDVKHLEGQIEEIESFIRSLGGDHKGGEYTLARTSLTALEHAVKRVKKEAKEASDAFKALLDSLDLRGIEEKGPLKQKYLDILLGGKPEEIKRAAQDLSEDIIRIDIKTLEDKKALLIKNKKNTVKVDNEILDLKTKLEEKIDANQKRRRDDEEAEEKKRLKESEKLFDDYWNSLFDKLERHKEKREKKLAEALAAGEITREEAETAAHETFAEVLKTGNTRQVEKAKIKLEILLKEIEIAAKKAEIATLEAFGLETDAPKIAGLKKEISDITNEISLLKRGIEDIDWDELGAALKDIGIDFAEDIINSFADKQLDKLEDLKDRQIDALNEEFRIKKDAAKGNAALEANIDKQHEKERIAIEKRIAREKQKIRIKTAIAETALAVIRYILNPVAMIAAAAAGAAQIAIIKAQGLRKGGRIKPDGTVEGPSHEQGGVRVVENGTPLEVEGGERRVIDELGNVNYINAKSASMFKPTLDKIQSKRFSGKAGILSSINSHNGYGVPLARDGIRIGSSVPSGVREAIVVSHNLNKRIEETFEKAIPEMAAAIVSATETGTNRGAFSGTSLGASEGLTRASQEAAENKRLLNSRVA